jgi:cytochrome c peroxidase
MFSRTAPYMHDGGLPTLEAVIDFYDGGGLPNPALSARIRPIQLTSDEKAALIAFLRALAGE